MLDLAALERALLADDPRLPCGEHPADWLVAPIGELRCRDHLDIEVASYEAASAWSAAQSSGFSSVK